MTTRNVIINITIMRMDIVQKRQRVIRHDRQASPFPFSNCFSPYGSVSALRLQSRKRFFSTRKKRDGTERGKRGSFITDQLPFSFRYFREVPKCPNSRVESMICLLMTLLARNVKTKLEKEPVRHTHTNLLVCET